MKIFVHAFFAVAFGTCSCVSAYGQSGPPVPEYIKIELKRLEETWRVLDFAAQKIWPGWTGYRDVPFHFRYPNGVVLLVGHPDPPDGFQLLAGLELSGKKVHIDRRQEAAVAVKPPLLGGGGPLPFGKTNRVNTVHLTMRDATITDEQAAEQQGDKTPKAVRVASENQVLINVHEIFHCFQRTVHESRHGNLRFNPDTDYALYGEVESRALASAYAASDEATAKDHLRDFLAARSLKRKSMAGDEQNQESEEEVREGTAVYAETRLLQLLKDGYSPGLTVEDDPYFLGFRDIDRFLDQKTESLRQSGLDSLEGSGRCYAYGSFQALMLSRLFPGWQAGFFQKGRFLSDEIAKALPLGEEERDTIGARLAQRYDLVELRTRHASRIGARDAAYASIQGRKGRTFVINFKPTGEYVSPDGYGESFRMGLLQLFPDGIREVKFNEVVFTGQKVPIVEDQLYYLKWVDTDWKPGEKGYELTFSRTGGPGVYYGAEVKTRGFTLKAPKIHVSDGPQRIKITILAKVSDS